MGARTLREEVKAGLPLIEVELEALAGAAHGEDYAATAERVHYSPETIKSARKDAIAKLRARNITHAVAIGIGHGYVNIEDVLEEHERG